MRVALASFSDDGGAGRAAVRLLDALVGAGADARMFVDRRSTDHPDVEGHSTRLEQRFAWLRPRVERRISRLQVTDDAVVRSPAVIPGSLFRRMDQWTPDVVNLHWLGEGGASVGQLGRLRRPVVWTLHDMWTFCGAEHYAPDDATARWRTGYRPGNRDPGHGGTDIDRWTWRRKRRRWRLSAHVVAPSRWLADCASNSELLSSWPVATIPYAVPLDRYRPRERSSARTRLGLPVDGPVVLFGAVGGGRDPRKGWDLLEAALPRVVADHPDARALVFGATEPADAPRLGLPIHWSGHISDDEALALHYAAADVAVVPSRQDNLPQTAVEAQSCGTPVVAFDTGGLADTLADRETGYLARPFETEDLARGISWVLADPGRHAGLSADARERAVRLWSPGVVARQYLEVYARARAEQSRGETTPGSHGR